MLSNTADILRDFGKRVVSRARANLTRQKKSVSKELYNSLKFENQVMPNSIFIRFVMEEYGTFIDKGVKGADPSLVKNGKQKAPMGKYTFRNKILFGGEMFPTQSVSTMCVCVPFCFQHVFKQTSFNCR